MVSSFPEDMHVPSPGTADSPKSLSAGILFGCGVFRQLFLPWFKFTRRLSVRCGCPTPTPCQGSSEMSHLGQFFTPA